MQICKNYKLTQEAVAKACKVNLMTYNKAERGRPIRDMTKAKIAAYWKLPIDFINWTNE